MIPSGPSVRLRSDIARQPERYARIDAYLRERGERRHRDYLAEMEANEREAARFVPCALCGGPTDPWDRNDPWDHTELHRSIVICGIHKRRMAGNFPFGHRAGRADLPAVVRQPFFAARVALYSLEQTMKERAHGQGH